MNRWISAVLALLACPAIASPPAGELDSGFGVMNGFTTTDFMRGQQGVDTADALAADAEGRLWLAGMTVGEWDHCIGIARYSSDGVPSNPYPYGNEPFCEKDFPFGNGPIAYPRMPLQMVIGPDGGPYIAARSYGIGSNGIGGSITYVCHFTPDLTWHSCVELPADGNYEGMRSGPALMVKDGELLVVTSHLVSPQVFRLSLADLSILGQYSVLAGQDEGLRAYVWDMDISPEGDMIVVGEAFVGVDADMFVARFDLDRMQPATSFDNDGFKRIAFNAVDAGFDTATSIRVTPDGDILVLGSFERTGGQAGIGLLRLDPSGENDASFNGGNPLKLLETYNVTAKPRAVDVLPSGKIVAAGSIERAGGVVDAFALRLLGDGTFDPVFAGGHPFFDPTGNAEHVTGMILQGDRLVLGGFVGYPENIEGDDENLSDFMLFRVSDGRLIHDSFEAPDIAPDK